MSLPPYQHIDMTPEYNRIIVALTGIRDDIRLLRTLQEDPESGVTTNQVLNDFQRAVVAVTMSTAGGNNAAAVADAINNGVTTNGGGIAEPSGDSNAELDAERASILSALGQDPETKRVLIRVEGFYYWEAEGTPGEDDGRRGAITQVVPFAQGELLGFDDEVSGSIIAGSPSGPPNQIPNPSKPRKRWPIARPEGSTASQLANPNADLIDPATGQIVGKSIADQRSDQASGTTTPPAVDYNE